MSSNDNQDLKAQKERLKLLKEIEDLKKQVGEEESTSEPERPRTKPKLIAKPIPKPQKPSAEEMMEEMQNTRKSLKEQISNFNQRNQAPQDQTDEYTGTYAKRPPFIPGNKFNEIKEELNTKPNMKVAFGVTTKSHMEFKGGNWALIWKKDIPTKIIPFVWQQDTETKRSWAIFNQAVFFGKKSSFFQLSWPLQIIEFDKSDEKVSYFQSGYLAAFDESTQLQIPLRVKESTATRDRALRDSMYRAQIMQVWRELISHMKKKWNWTLIIIMLVIAAIAIFVIYFLIKNPHALQSLGSSFGLGAILFKM